MKTSGEGTGRDGKGWDGKGRGAELCLTLLSGSSFPTEKHLSYDTEVGVGKQHRGPRHHQGGLGIHTGGAG